MAKDSSISILPVDDGALIQVTGRANFESAVPLREFAKGLTGSEIVRFDLHRCEAFDSTFMGVMSMMALKAARGGNPPVLCSASPNLQQLLRGLGVLKLFALEDHAPLSEFVAAPVAKADAVTTAETVLEAHQTLAEADAENAERFKAVIHFAEEDVKRLKK